MGTEIAKESAAIAKSRVSPFLLTPAKMCGTNDVGVDQIADPRARDDVAGQTLLPE